MKTGYFAFVSLYFLGLMIRGFYERLKKTGSVDPKNKITFAIAFVAMCLLWVSWFNMCPLDPYQINVSPVARWIGFGVFVMGLGLAIGALIQLRGVENINHLVTKGLFSRIRHPMYAGFILWIFGWAIYHGAVISFFLGLVVIVNIFYWKISEEKELESEYGEIYSKYRNRTWF